MGSLWVDPPQDSKIYPMQGQPVLPFDEGKMRVVTKYPDDDLGADFRAMIFLIEFAATDWRAQVVVPRQPDPSSQVMKDAIRDLVTLQQKHRQEALPEILAQNTEFQLYFCSQLGIYPQTYPKSYLMLKAAARIGEMAMAHYKRRYSAPRPSQIYPRLTPPVPVPLHGSYPSGHALISRLMARMAGYLVPEFADPAEKLAVRISRNREIAGLHFWWDGRAGASIADQLFENVITKAAKMPDLDKAYRDAKGAEWA